MVPVLSHWRNAGLTGYEDPQSWADLADGT